MFERENKGQCQDGCKQDLTIRLEMFESILVNCSEFWLSGMQQQTHTHARTNAHAHARVHTHAHARTNTHTHTHTMKDLDHG